MCGLNVSCFLSFSVRGVDFRDHLVLAFFREGRLLYRVIRADLSPRFDSVLVTIVVVHDQARRTRDCQAYRWFFSVRAGELRYANELVGCGHYIPHFTEFTKPAIFECEGCGLVVNGFPVKYCWQDDLRPYPARVRVDFTGHFEGFRDSRDSVRRNVQNADRLFASLDGGHSIVSHRAPVGGVLVRVQGVRPVLRASDRILLVGRYALSVLVSLLCLRRVQVKLAGDVRRAIAARIAGAQRVFEPMVTTMYPVPIAVLICLARELIRPVPSTAALDRQFVFGGVPVFLRTATAVPRNVRVFTGGGEAMGVLANCMLFGSVRATMRATVSVHVMVFFHAFVLCKAILFCQLRPIVHALGVGSVANFVTW